MEKKWSPFSITKVAVERMIRRLRARLGLLDNPCNVNLNSIDHPTNERKANSRRGSKLSDLHERR